MAVAFPGSEFDSWLSSRLKSFNTDVSVLVPYVKGILDSEEDDGEKKEALIGILCEISEDHVEDFCQEILKKWTQHHSDESLPMDRACVDVQNGHETHLEDRIAQIMHEQAENAVKKVSINSKQDAEMKQAIIAQYGEVADIGTDEEEAEEDGGAVPAQKIAGLTTVGKPEQAFLAHAHHKSKEKEKKDDASILLFRNTNAELVAKAEKEKREQAKAEAEKKKQQDKLNREKQKQAAQERKEREKHRTQKGERRR